MTDEVTEIPRCCSRRIQSEVAWRAALRPFTVPAIWMAPPNSSSFSVSVVLPASGWEMMAKVLLLLISRALTSSASTVDSPGIHKRPLAQLRTELRFEDCSVIGAYTRTANRTLLSEQGPAKCAHGL